MMRLGEVYIDSLVVGERHRALVKDRVGALAESMREIGLQNPIHVWSPDPTEAYLVAGRHRLAAAESLGWDEVPCFFVDMDEIDRELWEIDENLMRAGLSPAEEAAHLARRKELFEARNVGGENFPTKPQHQKGFAQDTAEKTGSDKSGVNKKLARAEAIPDIERVAGTSLDKGVELDALAKMGELDREDIIAKAQAGERVSARMSGASKRALAAETNDLKIEAVERVAAQIIDYVPGEQWDVLKSNCYSGGMKALGDAIARLTGVSVFDNTSAGRG
jgi:hypothetical protein